MEILYEIDGNKSNLLDHEDTSHGFMDTWRHKKSSKRKAVCQTERCQNLWAL